MFFFFFNDTATTEIYTLSLHDALPIYDHRRSPREKRPRIAQGCGREYRDGRSGPSIRLRWPALPQRAGRDLVRSEEHTSELQSRQYLVCRLLLEKKK